MIFLDDTLLYTAGGALSARWMPDDRISGYSSRLGAATAMARDEMTFEIQLYGQQFKLITDHQALTKRFGQKVKLSVLAAA